MLLQALLVSLSQQDPFVTRAELHKMLAPLQARVARLEDENAKLRQEGRARVAQLEDENARLRQEGPAVVSFSAAGRQLSHDSSISTCCRWTPDGSCTSEHSCTQLFEYLEHKTVTHEFVEAENANCLGSDRSAWEASFNGHDGTFLPSQTLPPLLSSRA